MLIRVDLPAPFSPTTVNAAFTNLKVDLLVGVHFAKPLIDTP
jgi:hypothetical protein